MKPLRESFIKAKDLDRLNKWPNPYNLTEEDKVNNMPLEIITLIIKETESGSKYNKYDKNHILKYIKDKNIHMLFIFNKSKDGRYFWWNIKDGNYDIFYKKYTPEKLKKRLEEE